jgi:hypothetical protein
VRSCHCWTKEPVFTRLDGVVLGPALVVLMLGVWAMVKRRFLYRLIPRWRRVTAQLRRGRGKGAGSARIGVSVHRAARLWPASLKRS